MGSKLIFEQQQFVADLVSDTQRKVRPVSAIVKAEGPSGRAKIHSDDPKHALGLAQYLRAIGYSAWGTQTAMRSTKRP